MVILWQTVPKKACVAAAEHDMHYLYLSLLQFTVTPDQS